MPRLAVLMPVRDAAATVARAVRSTLRDLPADAELVVADDGSVDATLAVLRRIADPRLRVLTGPAQGVARTLATLLDRSDSALVARMDADDVVLPGRFRRQVRALEHADAVFTTVAVRRGSGPPRVPVPSPIRPAAFPFHLLLTNPVAHSTMAARREALDAVGGYRAVPSEDYDLWLRLAADGARLRRLAAPSLIYRTHPGQVTAADGWRAQSWDDPQTQASFEHLSQRLLGRRFRRITSLAVTALPNAQRLALFAQFERRFREAVVGLPRLDQAALVHRLERRAEWFRQRICATAASHLPEAGS